MQPFFPPQLFKYMKSCHASRFKSDGTLRIGTLSEYRNVEKHGERIGDSHEGMVGHFETVATADVATLSPFVKRFVSGVAGRIENCTFTAMYESPEFFVFSTALEFSRELMKEFGYDACLRIDNPAAFFKAVTLSLQNVATYEGIFPCSYTDRFIPPGNFHAAHPAVIKDRAYESQREVRTLWHPVDGHASPRIIRCLRAIRHCTRVV